MIKAGELQEGVPHIPSEYIGRTIHGFGGGHKTAARDWTAQEIDWIKQLKEQGYTFKEIAKSVGRSEPSVSIKLKRLSKKRCTYNTDHVSEKYSTNTKFFGRIKPKIILDMYSGAKSWWRDNAKGAFVIDNDINKDADTGYHEKAEMLIHKLYYAGKKYDMIDLDPFGSAYDCFDLAIKMATKGIIITYGEIGHLRFKRLDFVSRYYGINNIEDFTIDRLIAETQKIALRSKKKLVPVYICNWNRISRVYYEIENIKITSQWDKR